MLICLTNTAMSTAHWKRAWFGFGRIEGKVPSIDDPHLFSVAAQGRAIICLL